MCWRLQVIPVFAGGLDFSSPVKKFFFDPLGSGKAFVATVVSLTGAMHPVDPSSAVLPFRTPGSRNLSWEWYPHCCLVPCMVAASAGICRQLPGAPATCIRHTLSIADLQVICSAHSTFVKYSMASNKYLRLCKLKRLQALRWWAAPRGRTRPRRWRP